MFSFATHFYSILVCILTINSTSLWFLNSYVFLLHLLRQLLDYELLQLLKDAFYSSYMQLFTSFYESSM